MVTKVPEGFETVGTSKDCPIASIQDTTRNFYGIQFHAEVRHSEYGIELLRHFAFDVFQVALILVSLGFFYKKRSVTN